MITRIVVALVLISVIIGGGMYEVHKIKADATKAANYACETGKLIALSTAHDAWQRQQDQIDAQAQADKDAADKQAEQAQVKIAGLNARLAKYQHAHPAPAACKVDAERQGVLNSLIGAQ